MLSFQSPTFKIRNLYLFCLIVIAIGLSLSKPLVTFGELGLLLIWVFDKGFPNRIISFYRNRTALALSSVYLLTLFGLFYTSNFDYAIGDVRRKIPLFFLPICIAGFPTISNKEFLLLFKCYVAGVLTASFWSIFVMLGGLNFTILDKRDLSRFNSHIRFGLEICFAIFGGIHYLVKEKNIRKKVLWSLIVFWLISFLIILNLFTGVVIFFLTSLFLLVIYSVNTPHKIVKYLFGGGVLLLSLGGGYIINSEVKEFYNCEEIEPLTLLKTTNLGENYQHNLYDNYSKENGYLVYNNIALEELKSTWNKRSDIKFDSLDLRGQKLKHTLIRFITSKGKRKNQQSVMSLTSKDINAIESGIANYKYMEMNGISKRLHKIIWEYNNYINGGGINGHSVTMRWIYWKTAYHIFLQNKLLGVGTGDLQDAFDKQYEIDGSTLEIQYRARAHNQYITYAVSFGVLGILGFLFFLIYPISINKMYRNYFYLAFFSIILLSMLSEDTLETQIGITFFAFFNTLFLLKETP